MQLPRYCYLFLLLLTLTRLDFLLPPSLAHCRLSNPSQLLSDKGEYKEAMEVLKKALKLEPATKVRLGGPGRHPRHVYFKCACESLTNKGKVTLKVGHHQYRSHCMPSTQMNAQ